MNVEQVCENCGSREISLDAWAAWDVGAQRWVLRTVFDQAFCHLCDKEVAIEAREIATA